MSLQTRIVALVSAVLLVSIALGVVFAGVQARRALHAEIDAGMLGGAQTIHSAFEDLPRSDHQQRDLVQLVETFNGNRHVAATLLSGAAVQAVSRAPGEPDAAPWWFRRLIAPAASNLVFAVPGQRAGGERIILKASVDADLKATWTELSGIVSVLCGSTVVGLALVWLVVRGALSPLRELSKGFAEIGRGDYRGRVRERGPVEILRLEQSFNEMTGRLGEMGRRNSTLEQQLLTLQDEERAELARDLHDDIGPHLFAVSLDAQLIAQLLASGRSEAIPDQVEAIQSTVGHVQREVRGMVARLRPARVTELGLDRAIQDLVRFWRSRRPEVAFDVQLSGTEAGFSDGLKDTAFRVVQEAVSNAVRHAEPTRIEIAIQGARDALTIEVRNDGASPGQGGPTGFGLVGMGERVRALGGRLTIRPALAKAGTWGVSALLPTSRDALDQMAEGAL